ncbi:ABC transporter ATP-binding protein [Kitasatospora sp. NPDC093550]|uniref:ABC transporter ATP-binding protein n=1 Tax=Kitasatospora sp. NPDC093550 TaxID=3364089 RepID=UPI0037FBE6AC
MDTAFAIEASGLTRTYRGSRKTAPRTALDGVSFQVPEGAVVGLLGPNGAGKTTCVKILTTLLEPTAGQARVLGHDVVADRRAVQRLVGVSFGGDSGLYTRLTARDNLRFFGTMYGLSGRALDSRVDDLLEQVELSDRRSDRVETFSWGMRQRLHIARALVHDPRVVILDEPSSGLDPRSVRGLRDLVRTLRGNGRTLLLTTHDLAEAEELCDSVLILDGGRIVREDSPARMRAESARRLGSCIELTLTGDPGETFLAEFPALVRSQVDGFDYRLFCTDASAGLAYVMSRVPGLLQLVEVAQPSLEDAYLDVLDEAIA